MSAAIDNSTARAVNSALGSRACLSFAGPAQDSRDGLERLPVLPPSRFFLSARVRATAILPGLLGSPSAKAVRRVGVTRLRPALGLRDSRASNGGVPAVTSASKSQAAVLPKWAPLTLRSRGCGTCRLIHQGDGCAPLNSALGAKNGKHQPRRSATTCNLYG